MQWMQWGITDIWRPNITFGTYVFRCKCKENDFPARVCTRARFDHRMFEPREKLTNTGWDIEGRELCLAASHGTQNGSQWFISESEYCHVAGDSKIAALNIKDQWLYGAPSTHQDVKANNILCWDWSYVHSHPRISYSRMDSNYITITSGVM